MNKPDWCPQDVWGSADDMAFYDPATENRDGSMNRYKLREAIARAILAAEKRGEEREISRLNAFANAVSQNGAALFLDGRNEHGSHVVPMHPNSMPEDAWAADCIPAMAEEIITASEALGFNIGDIVWAKFHWNAPQTGEFGRVEIEGYWEFSRIDVEASRILFGKRGV